MVPEWRTVAVAQELRVAERRHLTSKVRRNGGTLLEQP